MRVFKCGEHPPLEGRGLLLTVSFCIGWRGRGEPARARIEDRGQMLEIGNALLEACGTDCDRPRLPCKKVFANFLAEIFSYYLNLPTPLTPSPRGEGALLTCKFLHRLEEEG